MTSMQQAEADPETDKSTAGEVIRNTARYSKRNKQHRHIKVKHMSETEVKARMKNYLDFDMQLTKSMIWEFESFNIQV